ncbi:MAG: dihydrofolate reductase [Bacteroidales bacterium]|nr:dihydrofolate reductase [Bacteroidales bacterium]
MIISLIAAMGTNRVIGKGFKMPWHLPDELGYFMETTRNHSVLMGRKTFEAYRKVMSGHKVIVVTSQKNYNADYADVVHSVHEGIEKARLAGEQELFISGGGEIFKETIDIADKIYLTIIDHDFEGDVFFPELKEDQWRLISKVHHGTDERHAYKFDFLVYLKTD